MNQRHASIVNFLRHVLERQVRQEMCPDCGQMLDLADVYEHQAMCVMDPTNEAVRRFHYNDEITMKAQTRAKGYVVR
jgi:hypothetical protein